MKDALARLKELERQLEEHKRRTSEVLEYGRKLLSDDPPAEPRGRAAQPARRRKGGTTRSSR